MLPAFFMLAAMNAGLPFWAAILVGFALSTAILGFAFKRLLVDPMLRHGVLPLAIATMALSTFLKESVKTFYSAEASPFPSIAPEVDLAYLRRPDRPGRTSRSSVVAIAAVVALQFLLGRTRLGRQMQAAAQNPTVALILGVPVERMILYTFLINGALVALASLLISPIYLAKFTNGETLGLAAFIAAIVGGFNQIRGAIAGGLLLGVVDNLSAAYVSTQYRGAIPLFLLIAIILLRPERAARAARGAHGMSDLARSRWAARRDRRRARLSPPRAARAPSLRALHPQPVGGHDDRRDRPQSDARLRRPGLAGAGRLRRHRRLLRGDPDDPRLAVRAGVALALALCFAVGWLLGYPALRVQHHYLAFVTLAFSTLAFLVFRNEAWLTGGTDGIDGVARPTIFGVSTAPHSGLLLFLPLRARARRRSRRSGLVRSPWGRAFVALRENPLRALSLGVDTRRYTLMAFAIGSSLGGLAGALYAPLVGLVEPPAFTLTLSLNLLMMVIVGGSGYFLGPFLGAMVAVLLPEWLRFVESYYLILYSLLVMALLIYSPTGLIGIVDRTLVASPHARRLGRAGARSAPRSRVPDDAAGARSRRHEEALRRHHRGRRRLLRGRRGRNPRHHRAERLRQVDLVQLHPRAIVAERGRGEARRARHDRHAARATSTGSASAAPSSSCRSFPGSRCARTSFSPGRSTRARCSRGCSGRATRGSAPPPTR